MPIEVSFENMACEGNMDGQVMDVDKWVVSMERKLNNVPHYMCTRGHRGRISRVPQTLREVNAKAYEPYYLSISPYHHRKPSLQYMEPRKHEGLRRFLEHKPEITLKDYLKEVKSIESEARSFYSDVEMESEKFVRMLLIDSLYILAAFCGMPKCQQRVNYKSRKTESCGDNNDVNGMMNKIDEGMRTQDDNINDETGSDQNNVEDPRWFWFLFCHDIFLLENQVLFFVLQKIHDHAYGNCEPQLPSTLKNAFCTMLTDYARLDTEKVISATEEFHHLLHLCHKFFHPTIHRVAITHTLPDATQMFRLGSVVQLYEAGVEFEASSDLTQHTLLNVSFISGKMVIPCLYVEDNTESLFRNLVALEQMKYPSLGLHVSAYAVLLLHLITIPEDVKLLRRKGIIHHHLSSDKEMVYFVNRLSVGLAFDYVEDIYSLKPVFHELKSFSERRVPRWRAWLKHRYFTNPWMAIYLFAAALLLFLSILQTFYTVYSYYRPCIECLSRSP